MDCVNLILAHELLSVLRIERNVRLGVVSNDLDLLAEQAAGCIYFINGQAHGHVHRLAVGIKDPGRVEDRAEPDCVGGQRRARRHGSSSQSGGAYEKVASVQ